MTINNIKNIDILVNNAGIAHVGNAENTNLLDFEFIMSLKNILIGSGLSAVIGLLSGLIPAIFASKLDPVEAIRTGI